MALNVPNVGENAILEMIVNKTAAQDLILALYKNNVTPSDTDVHTDYTASTFTGYSPITLTGANWNAAAAGSISYGSQQAFTCSGAAAESVYGYYVRQAISNILLWSERAAGAPLAISVSGDEVRITPSIGAD